MELSVSVDGIVHFERSLSGTKRRAANMRPVLQLIARDFRRIMVLQFDTRGSYLGTDWAPESAATRERKARAGVDQRLLHWSRALRFSLTTGQEGVYDASTHDLQMGSLIPWAGFINEGTRNMPARTLFQMNKVTDQRWNRAMRKFLVNGVLEMGAL
jgi:hypothetical protein